VSSAPQVRNVSGGASAPPGFLLRLAAMTYEAVLLFGLAFATSLALLVLAGWSYPLSPSQRWVLQAVLFVVVGVYFVYCWVRAGQTLAMKSWRLRIVDGDGGRLTPARAVLRYLLAWSLFAPGLAFVALTNAGAVSNVVAFATGLLIMLALSRLDRRGQLLHDRILGSRVIRD